MDRKEEQGGSAKKDPQFHGLAIQSMLMLFPSHRTIKAGGDPARGWFSFWSSK